MPEVEPCDKTLVARLRSGDDDAARDLYDRYARRVFGFVQDQMSDHLAAQVEPQDIVQSVFKSVFRGMMSGGYDAPEGRTLWRLLAVIAVHKVRRNAARRAAAKRDSHKTVSLDVLPGQSFPARPTPLEIEQGIRETIEHLSETERTVVMLRLQGYSVEEISQRVQRSRRTIERTLQHIRQELVKDLDGP